MRTTVLSLACAAALAGTSSAQFAFDLILHDHIQVNGTPGTISSASWAAIVNTGTTVITGADWASASFYVESTEAFSFHSLIKNAAGPWALEPGEAFGIFAGDPLLQAELMPGETVAVNSQLTLWQGGGLSLGGTALTRFSLQMNGLIATATVQLDETGAVPIVPLSATRVSAAPSLAGYTRVLESECKNVSPFGDLDPQFRTKAVSNTPGRIAGVNPTIPIAGNKAFEVRMGQPGPAGSIWGYTLSASPAFAPYAGCDVHYNFFKLGGGLTTESPSPFGGVADPLRIPIPIPEKPSIVGLTFYFQIGILTPKAENGFLATTDGLAISIGS